MGTSVSAIPGCIAALAMAASLSAGAAEVSQEIEVCRIVAIQAASYLEQCGDRLLSFGLSFADIRRSVTHDAHGRFGFECPVDVLCADEPDIFGWFIDQKSWRKSAQDDKAILDVRHAPPLTAVAWRSGAATQQRPASSCGALAVQVAGMSGRVACFQFMDTRTSEVVVVTGDDTMGFILVFEQRALRPTELRDKVMQLLPQFEVERAFGDPALLKWVK